jgi:hypothetical protein
MTDEDVPAEQPGAADEDLASIVKGEHVEEVMAEERVTKPSTAPKHRATKQPSAAETRAPDPGPPRAATINETAEAVPGPTTGDYVTPLLHIRLSPHTVDLGLKATIGAAAVVGAVMFPPAGVAAAGLFVVRWRHENQAKDREDKAGEGRAETTR